ncbi:augmin subunit 5, partial [Quercus suber]
KNASKGKMPMELVILCFGMRSRLLEYDHKAHVQQFLATDDAWNKAAEARDLCQKLVKLSSNSLGVEGASQNVGSFRKFELIYAPSLLMSVLNYFMTRLNLTSDPPLHIEFLCLTSLFE